MKFVLFLLISLSLTLTFANCYKMIILGDSGHVESFMKNKYNSKNPEIYKLISKTKYVSGERTCKAVLEDNSEIVLANNAGDLPINYEGMVNLNNILCNAGVKQLFDNSDSGVILGDVLYVENKFAMGPDGHYKIEGKFTEDQIRSLWLDRIKCGWQIFYDVAKRCTSGNTNLQIMNSQGQLNRGFHILGGNHSYDADADEEVNQVSQVEKFITPRWKNDSKVTYIDESGKEYTKKSFWQWLISKSFSTYPRLITVKTTGNSLPVEIIDFNSQILTCLHYAEYPNDDKIVNDQVDDYKNNNYGNTLSDIGLRYKLCSEGGNKFMPGHIHPTYEQARTYFTAFVQAILKLSPNSSWRVLRAHHPPLNIEDKDEEFWWTDISVDEGKIKSTVQIEGISLDKKKVNLMRLIKAKNVQIILASHHHSASALIYPYSRVSSTTNPSDDGSNRVINNRGRVTDKDTNSHQCIVLDSVSGLSSNTVTVKRDDQSCDTPQNYTFSTKASDYLYVFITGNSGRKPFDPLLNDKFLTRAMNIWGRSRVLGTNVGNVGFSQATFEDNKFTIEYYENIDVANFTKVATFTINKSATDVIYPGLDSYLLNKKNGNRKKNIKKIK